MFGEKTRDVGQCLDDVEIQAVVRGNLSAEELSVMRLHADQCARCRRLLGEAGADAGSANRQQPRAADTAGSDELPSQQSSRGTTADDSQPVRNASSATYSFLAPPQAPDELGRLGNYRILRVLGEGGMGTVFEAEDLQLNRRVALKVLKQVLDSTTRQRFLQEARLAASLSSDRVVTIYHIGEDRGCPFIVMELLEGESLDGRLQRAGTLPVAESLRIAREAAEGLAAAHSKGLIHRDIKPANVWLERKDPTQSTFRVKLLDFGIARPLSSNAQLTKEGSIVGTPGYMCPEQAYGAALDARSDLFSLGCLLYAMLAGDSPFARSNTIQSIRAVVEDEARPIHETLPGVPHPIGALVRSLLSKDPAGRPPHAQAVVDELHGLEMIVQPTVGLPSGMRTALGFEKLRARLSLGWSGWAGVLAVTGAALIGLWVQYDHLATLARSDSGDNRSARSGGAIGSTAARGGRQNPLPAPPVALPPLKVGVLHSFSGPMVTSERPVADAQLFAIEEINAAGGVLGGRQLEPVVRDGRSFPDLFAQQAEELISQEHVATIFGVWRSSCRKSVEAVCRRHDHLLVYPKADEGLEQSPYVVYMGGAPNQQTIPAVKWAYAFLGKRKFFLIGTDGLFSRASNAIIKDELTNLGASLAGEEYCAVGEADFGPIVARLEKSGADVVLNTVSGTGNIALFRALSSAGLNPANMPVVSYDLTEEELRTLAERAESLAGNYAAWTYFQSLPDEANRQFIKRFRKRYGPTRTVNDPMAAAYAGVHLWALGVEAAKSDRPADIRQAMVRQQFQAPEGLVTIDPKTQRAVRMARIGQIDKHLEFEIVWASPKPIWPVVFPPTRSRQAWDEFLQSLRASWNGHWSPDLMAPAGDTAPLDNAKQSGNANQPGNTAPSGNTDPAIDAARGPEGQSP